MSQSSKRDNAPSVARMAAQDTAVGKAVSTSDPGRPGPDELVPSRYALKVGEIDVLVISDRVLSLGGRRHRGELCRS